MHPSGPEVLLLCRLYSDSIQRRLVAAATLVYETRYFKFLPRISFIYVILKYSKEYWGETEGLIEGMAWALWQ
eukprot:scaffold118302_cov20-Prasinocladus_malaysianus.AAC.1